MSRYVNPSSDVKEVGSGFVEHFFNVLDNNKSGLSYLYARDAKLTFEGFEIQGCANIISKLRRLPYQQTAVHQICGVYSQPFGSDRISVYVHGLVHLSPAASTYAGSIYFTQVFLLKKEAQRHVFNVTNHIFRLHYAM